MTVTRLTQVDVKHMPETKEPGILYVSKEFDLAIHLCACGCGGEAVTPLREPELNSGWILTQEANGPTLRPSIGHQKWPCRSHYFVTDGRIELCGDHGVGRKI
jgi:hypothetical protein